MATPQTKTHNESFTFTDAVTGRTVRQLTNHPQQRSVHAYYDNPPWCPKTRRIAFTRLLPHATEGDIYVMDDDGDNLTYLAHSRNVTANDGAMAQWSADGRRIYFKDREADTPLIAWVEVETGETGAYPGDLRMVRPVGNEQVYHSNCGYYSDEEIIRRRQEFGVFLLDLATGDTKQLVSVEECRQIHPRRDEIGDYHLYVKHTKWSQDGSRIMFVFTNEIRYEHKYAEQPRVKDVYVVNADGTGLARVGEFGNHPLWRPNGRAILTNSPWEGRPGNSLVLLDVETSERRLATTAIAGSGHPSYSPDGTHIAVDYVLPREGYGSINLVDVAADTATHLLQMRVIDHTHVGTHLHPVWSRDGRQILYASDASGLAQLCVVDV